MFVIIFAKYGGKSISKDVYDICTVVRPKFFEVVCEIIFRKFFFLTEISACLA